MKFLILFITVLLTSCQQCGSPSSKVTQSDSSNSTKTNEKPANTNLNNGNASVKIDEIKPGTGEFIENGDKIKVHYVGKLKGSDEPFDSSRKRGTPFEFELGTPRIIKGWNIGLQGAKVGEIRKLTIPPHLGYGERGAGGRIPPNSTLEFEIEVVSKSN